MWLAVRKRKGCKASPYIPGVDVAVVGGSGGLVGDPRVHSSLQRSSVGKLITIPCVKRRLDAYVGRSSFGWEKLLATGIMRRDRGDALHDHSNGNEKVVIAHVS